MGKKLRLRSVNAARFGPAERQIAGICPVTRVKHPEASSGRQFVMTANLRWSWPAAERHQVERIAIGMSAPT
jgi:hypothetical protein